MKRGKRWITMSAAAAIALMLGAIACSNRQPGKRDVSAGTTGVFPGLPGPVVPMRKLQSIGSRTFNEPFELRASARDGMVLLTTDTLHTDIELVINGHRAHLIGLSSESLEWVGGFRMPGNHWDWSGGTLLTSPTTNKTLFHNQYVDLDTWTSAVSLPHISVSGMENVVPEPLDISPNGKSALVRIRSYSKRDLDTTVLYDLESGAIKLKLPQRADLTGNHRALHRLRNDPTPDSAKNTTLTACFLNNDTVALMQLDGMLDILNTDTNHRDTIPSKPLGDASYRHNARLLPIRNSPYLVCWVYGANGMTVIDWQNKRILWRADGPGTRPIHHDGKLLYADDSVWKQAEGLCIHMKDAAIGRSVLAVREVASGNLVMEYEWEERFDSVALDAEHNILWAADGNTLYKYRIDLTMPQRREGKQMPNKSDAGDGK